MLISKLAEYESVNTQRKLIKRQLSHYKELENTFKGQIESGQSVYQRFSEVDVERAEAERKLNDLQARKETIEAEFIRLVDNIPDIDLPEIPDIEWSESPQALYPVMIAGEDIDIAKKDVGIADAAFLPNFGVSAVYKQREDGERGSFSGDDWFSIQAKISIPLWADSNQKPKRQAALENERSAKFAYDDVRRQWEKVMKSLKSNRDAASKNVKVLQDKDWSMKKKIDAAQRNYEAGTDNLDAVLFAKIDRLNIQSQLAAVKASYVSRSAEFNSNIINAYAQSNSQEISE
jgi:outer membrane protein TolC